MDGDYILLNFLPKGGEMSLRTGSLVMASYHFLKISLKVLRVFIIMGKDSLK